MKTMRRKIDAALCVTLLGIAAVSPADDAAVQSHDSIRETARQHVLAQVDRFPGRPEISVGSLDSRLRLAACDLPLTSYDSPNGLNGGRGVVGVRCEGSRPWKLYVPVQLALLEPVVVSRRPVARGQPVSAEDLMLSEVDTTTLHKAYFSRIDDVVGLNSKRDIASGTTLHAGMLERATLVKRGAQVEIVALTDGLQVRMRGKAMADGGRGDRVKVKNTYSGRVVTGTVAAAGVIHVFN